ncbi:UDP-N-acetylglucosamine 1-carboxyvinyltransferase [uncultured Peptoniphilus sp.]|uniref:UDP-N-acetylglucosamine 1-carboxyvinyltransferase n=1 Tax=uncultured Peptoniphilus sp. TaxID=254354 RepID=UPI0028061BC1|nr:UDP-N-acetylglucosamine 1-carboxyvinyltransferase [uncultured Peptoniphilus sp.]
MEKIIVRPNGPLRGNVRIGGAKNAALPILAASLLGTEDIILEDVPKLKDVEIILEVLRGLGAKIKYEGNLLIINSKNLTSYETNYDLMSKMRASFLVMGPLIARMGIAVNSLPGGCAIGSRPIDLHLKGFKALGADVEMTHGNISAKTKKLVGKRIYLDFPSVGATENIMMAATLADGETILENCAMEPEIVDLANFLNKLGAKITGAGTSNIKIKGVEKLFGARHQIIPDRIVAGTFMVAAAITSGDIFLDNIITNHMKPIIAKLEEAGVEIITNGDKLQIKGREKISPIEIKTLPHPGFPTDMQAQFMSMLTQAEGQSSIIETVFENRFMHVDELKKMGAVIKVVDREAIILGKNKLYGSKVNATDLRGGAALILAGLVAEGETQISEIQHIDRGYEDIVGKFKNLGADITRI